MPGRSFVTSITNSDNAQDCRDVEHLIKDTFTGEEIPDALIVYVGDRSQYVLYLFCQFGPIHASFQMESWIKSISKEPLVSYEYPDDHQVI